MSCPIKQAIEIVNKSGNTALIDRMNKIIEANTEVKLGSEPTSPNAELMRRLGGRVDVIKGKKTFKNSELESVLFNADKSKVTIKVKIGAGTYQYTFKVGTGGYTSEPTAKGDTVKVPHLYSIADQVVRGVTLKSEESAEPKITKNSLRRDALKSPEGMKALIDELGEVDEGYKKYVHGLIDMIGTEFIQNKDLYLNKDAERNAGIIGAEGIIIDVASNMDESDKTATEVYAHELMHAITKFAIESRIPGAYQTILQLETLRDEAAELFTYEDFMPTQYTDEEAATAKAKDVYNYIFKGKNSLHEFIAYGMTNPIVMNKLRANKSKRANKTTNLFQWLQELAQQLLDIALGKVKWNNVNASMKKQLHQLTFELMQHNNKAVNHVKSNAESTLIEILGKTIGIGNKELSKAVDMISDALKGEEGTVPKKPENASVAESAEYFVKFFPKLMLREDMRGVRETVLSSFGMHPEGTLQNIMRDVGTPTELERMIEQVAMSSDSIDRVRELTVDVTRSEIRSKFDRELTKVEEEAITLSALDTDIGTVYEKYGSKVITKLLRDKEALAKKISTVKTELAHMDRDNFNWNSNQATGLGYFLATGKAGIVQNLNAHNIAARILTNKRRKADPKLVKKIDELATLVGMQYTKDASNALLADMIEENAEAVGFIVELNEGAKRDARAQIFETDVNIIKGYSKEIADDTIDIRVRPVKDQKIMEHEGFELVEVLKKDTQDRSSTEMAIYRSKMYVNNSYNRAATRITNIQKKGTGLSDIAFSDGTGTAHRALRREVKRIGVESQEIIKQMEKGEYTPNPDGLMSPVLNQDGVVVDYRYMMGKDRKKELLNQNTKVTEVLGRTLGSIRDKVDTNLQNQVVLDLILRDMKENYVDGASTGRNGQQYIVIEANSPNKTVAEIYKLLPSHMIQAINDSDKGMIAVRRDMLHNYFGFRDKSSVDFFGIHHITPDILQKWIKVAEKMWMQIVSISKVDIIIRTPAVFISNVISNFMYSVVNGTPPWKVLKMQIRNMQAITTYLEKQREIEKLRIAGLTGKDTKKRMEMLEHELTRNPVHDLMEAGMYQAIVEDLNKQDYKSSNKLINRINDATEGLPEYIKTGASWLYLGEKTGFFQFVTKSTQYSDFIARATEYQLLRENGTEKKEALENVLDVFVNYGKPASSFEEYLNNMGLFMFTKYMKRITRVVHKSIKDKPLNVLLSILGQEAFFEVDDIQDQNLLTRSFANLNQDMFKHMERALVPSSLQLLGIVKD